MMSTGITDFYAGRSIFITGASGFLGKVLMEKLLRSCPAVKTLYVLIRPKKGQDASQRLADILKSKLFEKLRNENSAFGDKVVAISGDIIEPQLGISQKDYELLISEVSVVFHSAATVKFDEALKLSVKMNVFGVQKLIELCKNMKKLETFVHVSTAYANCDKGHIQESVYPPPLQPNKLLNAVEWMDDEVVNALTPKLIKGRPNTYTYTKALAECLLMEEGKDLPLAIIRPSIVGASWQEPIVGWVDNFNGPSGIIAGIGSGLLRSMKGDSSAIADIVPVDLCANMMIAVAWYTALERPDNIHVYHCTTGHTKQLTWHRIERAVYKYVIKYPLDNMVRLPDPHFSRSRIFHLLKFWLDHKLPAFVLDLYRRLAGQKPVFMKITDRIQRSVESLDFFTSHSWVFSTEKLNMLLNQLNPEDRKTFNFDMKRIHWDTYIENYCLGTKCYALKEELSNMTSAKKRLSRLQTLALISNAVMIVVIWRLLVNRVAVARQVWDFFMSIAIKIFRKIPGFAKST